MQPTNRSLSKIVLTLALCAALPALAMDEALPSAGAPAAADPVLAGFERMLTHTATRHVPPLPAGARPDPLIQAVVLPLVRANREEFAGTRTRRQDS